MTPTATPTTAWCDGIAHAARQLDGLPPARRSRITSRRRASCSRKPACCSPGTPAATSCRSPDAADHERLKQDRVRVHDGATTLRAVIERERLRLALDALVLFAHWVTPPIDTRQFDTRFFMTRVPPHQTPAHDDTETTHSLWVAAGRRDRAVEAATKSCCRRRPGARCASSSRSSR